jgi:hypothetical protein
MIIVHHAAATMASMGDIHRWHLEKGWNGFAYNFYIPKEGGVWEGRPIWAADADSTGHNYDSLSIVFEGNFNIESPTPAQGASGIELIRYLRAEFPSVKRVVRHRDVGDTSCPGDHFNDQIIIQGLSDGDKIKSVDEAIKKLTRLGIMKNPEYWQSAARTTKFLDVLLINITNYIKE